VKSYYIELDMEMTRDSAGFLRNLTV